MRRFVSLPVSLLSFCLLPGSALAAEGAASGDVARYEVTFERGWDAKAFPQDFPLLAHFSPVIGATHASGKAPFAIGATASDGLEKLCEEGKHQPLDAEIQSAIKQGNAGALIETMEPIRDEHGKAVATFQVDATHPRVSIAAMIAPSPDWCAAALDIDLRDGGGWVREKRVELYSYDAGTDAATSYRALDSDMKPRGALQPNSAPYFNQASKPKSVGKLTFVRQ